MTPTPSALAVTHVRRWLPRRVLVMRAASELPHTAEVLRRATEAGVEEIDVVGRVSAPKGASERETYAWAKSTLALVVAPPSARKPQPIPPSADWRIDLARGCPAHCQYCYLAGSLTGPPVTRVFANLDEVLAPI
ncbi:MAG: spore photoproduct lyase family protein, partial [Janthinobacterium lividum]